MIEHPNPTPAFQFLTHVVDHLVNDCGWPINRIHFFGFSQGGSVAVEFVIERWKAQQLQVRKAIGSGSESAEQASSPVLTVSTFASVITVSGPLLSYPTLSTRCSTPILVVHRTPPAETAGTLNAFKKAYRDITESRMASKATGMPASREEWEPIMRFWSSNLSRRQVEGLYEVMTGASSS